MTKARRLTELCISVEKDGSLDALDELVKGLSTYTESEFGQVFPTIWKTVIAFVKKHNYDLSGIGFRIGSEYFPKYVKDDGGETDDV